MRDVYLSENAVIVNHPQDPDPEDNEYRAIELFLAENPQPSNAFTREDTEESFRVSNWCEDWCEKWPDLEKGLKNKGYLVYQRIMGESKSIGVIYSYDANKVIIHCYTELDP